MILKICGTKQIKIKDIIKEREFYSTYNNFDSKIHIFLKHEQNYHKV